MALLLNWRVWVAIALAAALAFSHFTAYRSGKNHVRTEWKAAIAEANIAARETERLRQRSVDKAAELGAARQARIVADAARARAVAHGLRDELDATRQFSAQSSDAARKSVAALSDVFEQCSRAYIELAEIADRHANDSLKLQQSWPK